MDHERHIVRGAIAGMVGGMVASWVMNAFMGAPAGKKLQGVVESDALKQHDALQPQAAADPSREDASIGGAEEAIKELELAGDRVCSSSEKERRGPVIHYGLGAFMGALYGGFAECAPRITDGAGTSFGTLLVAGADLIAISALGLSQSSSQRPAARLASPFVAHVVYGVTTDLVRRTLR